MSINNSPVIKDKLAAVKQLTGEINALIFKVTDLKNAGHYKVAFEVLAMVDAKRANITGIQNELLSYAGVK